MSADGDAAIRAAEPDDTADAMRVVEGALLDVDAGEIRRRSADGDVLVAEVHGTVVGAIVLDADGERAHVDALAVARPRRGRGIGTALVEAAADRHAELTADCRPAVEAFWTGLGFEIVERGERLRGRRG